MAATTERIQGELIDKVIKIRRCAAVVKGGRRFSFAAMVVVGNGTAASVGDMAKANEVPPAVDKAQKDAQRSMIDVPMEGATIPHVTAKATLERPMSFSFRPALEPA